MAIYQITAANSVTTTAAGADAFNGDTPAADTLIVDAGAHLKTEDISAYGAFLDDTMAWTVQVDGLIRSAKSIGINLESGNLGSSTISVGVTGEVYGGSFGIYSDSAVNVANAGKISGVHVAISVDGLSGRTITNTGTITSAGYSIITGRGADIVTNSGFVEGKVSLQEGNDRLANTNVIFDPVDMGEGDDTVTNAKPAVMFGDVDLGIGHDKITNAGGIAGVLSGGDGNDAITNSGTIGKTVTLGSGLNTLTNSGSILGSVLGGADKDVVKNSGAIEGIVDLGDGEDMFTGGNRTDIVLDGAGSDVFKLGGGDDFYYGVGGFNPAYDGPDQVDGGAGLDIYNATSATDAVYINLDKVAHDFAPFLPGAGLVAGNTATGLGLTADTIKNFEAVLGGAGSDIIYGSSAANVISGNDGFDTLAGFAGNDVLNGGAGGDALWGGAGRDVLNGGVGADFFQFAAASESGIGATKRDVVTDFETGIDKIDLRPIDANTKTGAVNDAFTFIGADPFSGVAGQLRIYAPAGMQIIEGDINGDKKADFSIEVTTTPATLLLTATDFLL